MGEEVVFSLVLSPRAGRVASGGRAGGRKGRQEGK